MKSKKATRVQKIQAELGAMAAQLRDMLKRGRAYRAELERMPEYKAASKAGNMKFDPAIVRQQNSIPYSIAGDLCELIEKAPDIVTALVRAARATEAQMRRDDEADHARQLEQHQPGEDEMVAISRAALERLQAHIGRSVTNLAWATREVESAKPAETGRKAVAA